MAVCLGPWFARSGMLRPGGAVAWSGIRDRTATVGSTLFHTLFPQHSPAFGGYLGRVFPWSVFVQNLVAPNQLRLFDIDTEVVVLQIVPALPLLQQFFKGVKRSDGLLPELHSLQYYSAKCKHISDYFNAALLFTEFIEIGCLAVIGGKYTRHSLPSQFFLQDVRLSVTIME